MFGELEELGLIHGYENVIASVGYEYIEAHVLETYAGQWGNTMLNLLRLWMSDKVVPWMLVIYARGAATGGCFFFAFFGELLTRVLLCCSRGGEEAAWCRIEV